jgi:hypothetical protein
MPVIDHYKLDPDQARQLARKFDHQADVETKALIDSMNEGVRRMQQMITDLNSGVKSMDWAGRRASAFDNQWEGEFRPSLQRMQQSIEEFTPVLTKMQLALKQGSADMNRHAHDTELIDH